MQRRRLTITPDNALEPLRQSLSEKFPSQILEINNDEKEKISNTILNIKFPYSVKNIQVYMDELTVKSLADSLHPVLKEWGEKCLPVYTDPSLNKFIEPASGLVVAKRGGISIEIGWCQRRFVGNGVWNISTNSWIPAPGSQCAHGDDLLNIYLAETLYGGYQLFYSTPILPPNLSTSPFKSLSPVHIAVLLDDAKLIEYLISKDIRVDDDLNEWHLTPIEFAVMYERHNAFDCLLKNNATKNLDKATKIAIEKTSFPFIEKLINGVSLTQEAIEVARVRDYQLYVYLEAKRKNAALNTIETEGEVKALQSFLDQKIIPILSIADLICDYPEIVNNPLPNDPDENTIFHWAIKTGDLKKVEALFEGTHQAKLRSSEVNVDVKQNKESKTVLDLALAQTNHEIKAAVILYGHHEPKFTDSQKAQINPEEIDLSAIANSKNNKTQNIIRSLNQRLDTTEAVAMETVFRQMEMKEELIQMKEEQIRLKQQVMQMEQMFMLLCQHVNNVMPNDEVVRPQQPMLQQANNLNRLFAFPQNNINEPVAINNEPVAGNIAQQRSAFNRN